MLKIISGGQTGADRAALDWAIFHGLPCGGWCPRGRLAEDGPISNRYPLNETPEADYAQRTEWNVREANVTVVFSLARVLSGGSRLTCELASQIGKPCLHLSQADHGAKAADMLRAFLARHEVQSLNIAGPRASQEPAISDFVQRTLTAALRDAPD